MRSQDSHQLKMTELMDHGESSCFEASINQLEQLLKELFVQFKFITSDFVTISSNDRLLDHLIEF